VLPQRRRLAALRSVAAIDDLVQDVAKPLASRDATPTTLSGQIRSRCTRETHGGARVRRYLRRVTALSASVGETLQGVGGDSGGGCD
jgi:hypothetical protein